MTTINKKYLTLFVCVVMFLATGISGCQENQPPQQQTQQQEENEKIPVSVWLVDHTGPAGWVVLSFFVDRQVGGTTGRYCCVMLPKHWRPGLSFELYWDYTSQSEGSPPPQKKQVEIEEYKPDRVGLLHIHIYPDHRVKAISNDRGFTSPFYPLPKEEWLGWSVNRALLRRWRFSYYEMIKGNSFIPDDEDWKWAAQWGLYKEEAMYKDYPPKQEQQP